MAIQRGFVASRQLVLNIVGVDAHSRSQASFKYFNKESILASWDFLAAFPSVRHQWVLAVFRAYGFPVGSCSFIEALFQDSYAIYVSQGSQSFLYLILAGIVQGCPSAGMCFAVAADPFFKLLDSLQKKYCPPIGNRLIASLADVPMILGGAPGSDKLLKVD